jgi:hypothetical protein
LLVCVAVAVASACSDSTGPSSEVKGTYTLISVNGVLLPVVFFADQFFTLRVTSGTLTMNSNNTFSTSVTYQQTPAGGGQTSTTTEACTGTYTMNGNTIGFTEAGSTNTSCGGAYNGTWDGANTLTIDVDLGVQVVFQK